MIQDGHGAAEVLEEREVPEPALRDTDILVAVHATSVNPVDVKTRRGGGAPRQFPLILGYDVSGVVVRRGARVSSWREGDEVFATANLFRDGANAQYVAIDARSAARKPASIDHATAAALPLVSQTAWEALHLRARIAPGHTVLVQAGAGGVGHIAVQLAKLHGCRVLTSAGRDASVAFCRDVLRADEVLDYRSAPLLERVRELTAGRGAEVVLDAVGGEVFAQSLECAAINGQVVTILGSETQGRGRGLLYRNISVHYEFMGVPTAHELDPERPGQILSGIARLVDAGLLRPHVSQRVPLERLADAHRQVETGHTIGKVVVQVAPQR
jgi:NADPH2:quinone reductase